MSLLTIEAQLPNIDSAIRRLSGKVKLPYTSEAVQESTNIIQQTWIAYAQGAYVSFSGGTFRVNTVTGEYVRSISEGKRFPSDMTGEVFTTSPHGRLIEEGQPARDMKIAMLNGGKAKVTKDGKGKYVTVPFRHGTPGAVTMPAMPKRIYGQAKQLTYSRVNGELSQDKYSWGGRLKPSAWGQRSHTGDHPSAAGSPGKQGYTWKTGQYSGMVRVGQPGHSQYFTFRRLSSNSDPKSWMHPGVKPKPIREAVIENTRADVLQLIRNGFEMDLYFMGLGGS